MGYNVLAVDELGLTSIELMGLVKGININVIGVKDEIDAVSVLHNKASSINAIMWIANSLDFREFEAIKKIKSNDTYKHIPIMLISKYADKRYVIKAIECGAVEFVARPFDVETIVKKIRKVLGVSEVVAASKEEEDLVTFTFSEMLAREIKAASRGKYSLSVLLAGIISQKNDILSQGEANQIIEVISKVVKNRLRDTDITFRYGTGNLIALLPFADTQGAKIVEEKVQKIFRTNSLIKLKNDKGYELVTVSATFPEDGKTKGQLLAKLENNLASANKPKLNN